MSRNGSGTYNLPAGNPVVTGTTITTTWANTTLNDIAASLTGSVAADGQTPMTGVLNMANNKITALATPTASTDAVTKAYADALTAALGTMAVQNANSVAITGGAIDGTTIGTTTPASGKFTTLDASGAVTFTSTGAVKIPVGTTAQQPTPVTGMIRYDSTLGQFQGYSTVWGSLGGGATGGGSDQVFVLNDQVVTTDYTIASTKNASSAGPISINTGVTVTISTGANWVIV